MRFLLYHLTGIFHSRRWDYDPTMKPYSVHKHGYHHDNHQHAHAHVGMKMTETAEEEEEYEDEYNHGGGHDESEHHQRLEVTSPFLGWILEFHSSRLG